MGKKSKPDEPEQYEIWILTEVKGWFQVEEDGDSIFTNKSRALLLAQKKSGGTGVVETIVFARRAIATFNGEAVGAKHRLKVIEKKEVPDAPVHSGGEKEVDVPDTGPADQPEAGPGGA